MAELFDGLASGVDEETFAVSEMTVPAAVPVLAVIRTAKFAEAPAAREGLKQVMVPAVLVAGLVQLQPTGVGMEAKVAVPVGRVGIVSVKVTGAAAGP